jgi:hypothetical protein
MAPELQKRSAVIRISLSGQEEKGLTGKKKRRPWGAFPKLLQMSTGLLIWFELVVAVAHSDAPFDG